MKKVQDYHIQYHWQEEAYKMKKRNEIKKKAFEIVIIVAFIALNVAIGYELMSLIVG